MSPFEPLTQQEPAVSRWVFSHVQGSDWGRSRGPAENSTFSPGTFAVQVLGQGVSLPNATSYIEPTGHMGLGFTEDHPYTSSGVYSPSGLWGINSVQDSGHCGCSDPINRLALVLADGPAMNHALQADDELRGYSVSLTHPPTQILDAVDSGSQASRLDTGTEENFKIVDFRAFPPMDTHPSYWSNGQATIRSSVEDPSELANPVGWIDGPSYLWEPNQAVDFEAAACTPGLPLANASGGPIRLCEWKDENGVVCGDVVTGATLPEHLSTHGIKNMTRDRHMMCNWLDCKRKKPVKRESIVRHVREVHMRMKRPPKKRIQEPRQ